MEMLLALGVLAAALVLAARGIEPVPTWFYVFAWYPTLVLLDAGAARLDRGGRWLARAPLAVSLFAWSVPIWMIFEAINFRIRNWYYVNLPGHALERWSGIVVSFATVVPAVVLAERLIRALGIGRTWRPRPLALGVPRVAWLAALGAGMLGVVLVAPNWAYPLTWGAAWLLADPLVYRRAPQWSLIADLERGYWARPARLMLGGLLIGFLWEGYNHLARGKWIYTVPLLEDLKWFEMPPLGFLGFPFFALEAWALYHALAALGWAVPLPAPVPAAEAGTVPERRPLPRRWALVATIAAGLFTIATLAGMERWTISSTAPAVALSGGSRPVSTWRVAAMEPGSLARQLAIAPDSAARLIQRARLATLRGIGSRHAARLEQAGVRSVCQLARQDPAALWRTLRTLEPGPVVRPTPAEVRVWVRAARRACPP